MYARYKPIIVKLNSNDSHYLVYLSHHNIEYKRVRGDIKEFEPCCECLDETNRGFIEFDKKVEDKIINLFNIN